MLGRSADALLKATAVRFSFCCRPTKVLRTPLQALIPVAGLVPATHVLGNRCCASAGKKTWMAGSSPAMTKVRAGSVLAMTLAYGFKISFCTRQFSSSAT